MSERTTRNEGQTSSKLNCIFETFHFSFLPTDENPVKKRKALGSNFVECLTANVYLKKRDKSCERTNFEMKFGIERTNKD